MKTVDVGPDDVVVVDVSDIAAAESQLVRVLAESGHSVASVTRGSTSLEEVFLEVTR